MNEINRETIAIKIQALQEARQQMRVALSLQIALQGSVNPFAVNHVFEVMISNLYEEMEKIK